MDLDFFPDEITAAFKACDLSDIYEIRLRTGFPILMKGTSKTYYLGKLGKTVNTSYPSPLKFRLILLKPK